MYRYRYKVLKVIQNQVNSQISIFLPLEFVVFLIRNCLCTYGNNLKIIYCINYLIYWKTKLVAALSVFFTNIYC